MGRKAVHIPEFRMVREESLPGWIMCCGPPLGETLDMLLTQYFPDVGCGQFRAVDPLHPSGFRSVADQLVRGSVAGAEDRRIPVTSFLGNREPFLADVGGLILGHLRHMSMLAASLEIESRPETEISRWLMARNCRVEATPSFGIGRWSKTTCTWTEGEELSRTTPVWSSNEL